jgi:hypothetical protein
MPPQFAALIFILIILYLFRTDFKANDKSSMALWIPIIWMFLAGSRFVSQWLTLGTPLMSSEAYIEGSPLDRNVFLLLILAGIWVLCQRKVNWNEFLTQNFWILLFFSTVDSVSYGPIIPLFHLRG